MSKPETKQYVGYVGSDSISSANKPHNENENHVSVFVPGKSDPMEAEVTFRLSEDDVTKYMNITTNTPQDQNPVIYWYQVAMDAIKSAESAQKRAKQADNERARAERELHNLTSGLVERTADKRALIPLDMSRIIDMAAAGTIDLNVSLFISKGKENTHNAYEEDD